MTTTIFLVINPPESASKADAVRTVVAPTVSGPATATPTRPGSQPTRTATITSTTPAASTTAAPGGTPGQGQSYTVEAGDSLSRIAERFSTTQQAIRDANPGLTDTLQIGQILRIPAASR